MNSVEFYAAQSLITDPGEFEFLFPDLPAEPYELCGVIRGVFLDYKRWYQVPVGTEMLLQTDAHYVCEILENLMRLKNAPLTEERDAPERVFASVSDYAALFCSVLRDRGRACRKRVGYKSGDVWKSYDVAEFLDGSSWRMIDPAGFLDGGFLPAAQAWLDWRAGRMRPEQFRGDPYRGENVLLANLMLDLASVNKMEMLNWDRYGWMLRPLDTFSEGIWETLDRCAEMLLVPDEFFEDLRQLYIQEEGLRVPPAFDCMNPVVKSHRFHLHADAMFEVADYE